VKCEKISVEYGVIFLILQQVRRATSWVSAGRMRPAGRMLCTPAIGCTPALSVSDSVLEDHCFITICYTKIHFHFHFHFHCAFTYFRAYGLLSEINEENDDNVLIGLIGSLLSLFTECASLIMSK